MGKIAIYPGSFDPVTYGHIDIIQRASLLFDKLIVAVLVNPAKKPLFSLEERVHLLEEVTKDIARVEVSNFDGLLVDYAKKVDATAIIKGLRMISDFEYEFQMALINKKLYPSVETVFLMTNNKYGYLSSSVVKEIAEFGGCLSEFVPDIVSNELNKKFKK